MSSLFVQIEKSSQSAAKGSILLVHGSWGSSAMWMAYTKFLSQKGWDVYAIDLRGHGQSGGTVAGTTMEDYVADVHKAAQNNRLENPIIIGHSMGGLVVLMYAAQHGARAVVSINPSPSKEVQGPGEEKTYPDEYSPMDAGMPTDEAEVMKAFPDIPQEKLMKMKEVLGMESGVARSERKLGVSIPKDKLPMPLLFVGSELGGTVAFGIGIDDARPMAEYYGGDLIEIKGATHPGILVGTHALEAAEKIAAWLDTNTRVT